MGEVKGFVRGLCGEIRVLQGGIVLSLAGELMKGGTS